jgi:uncharacterized protein YndB with AHSA1/START domain
MAEKGNRSASKPGKGDLIITRVFDAPRGLVWKAWTEPERLMHWWGPKSLATSIDKMDVRPGGAWRFVQRDSSGKEYAFKGVYREIVPPERLVYTFEFEGMPGHVILETVTFEDLKGKTKLTATSLFQTVEDRDGMLTSGMEEGAAETMDRLEELLAKN